MLASLIGQLVLGWLLADFVTGLLHHVYDRIWWPGFLALANDDHHARPLLFVGATVRARSGLSAAVALVLFGLVSALYGCSPFLVALCLGLASWNEVHRWAHAPRLAPSWARVLQRTGLLQSPRGHACHHTPTNAAGFCLLSDWLNPLLDAAGLWSRIERLVRARPLRGPGEPRVEPDDWRSIPPPGGANEAGEFVDPDNWRNG